MNLSWKEWLGVVGVGLAMSYAARAAQNRATSASGHQLAMLLSGAALYSVGVAIGARRPPEGWAGLPALTQR
jgi:hypothetical protein